MVAGGRHPVIEKLLEDRGERFRAQRSLSRRGFAIFCCSSPARTWAENRLTFARAALICILAQMGSFEFPAAQAKLPLLDRVFTRIGASDNLARGRSTFLVEMSEVAAILNTATAASLVLLDEVGRGTATYDGLSIAWAVVESLHRGARPKTLFATHYHELTELEQLLPGVKNVHVSVARRKRDCLPPPRRTRQRRQKLWNRSRPPRRPSPGRDRPRPRNPPPPRKKRREAFPPSFSPGSQPTAPQQTSFTAIDESVLTSLRKADLNVLTPLEALNLATALQKQLS